MFWFGIRDACLDLVSIYDHLRFLHPCSWPLRHTTPIPLSDRMTNPYKEMSNNYASGKFYL